MDENNALDWFGDDKATTADEGIDQLLPAELKGTTNEMIKMDRTHPGNYTITLEAHTDGAPQANIYVGLTLTKTAPLMKMNVLSWLLLPRMVLLL